MLKVCECESPLCGLGIRLLFNEQRRTLCFASSSFVIGAGSAWRGPARPLPLLFFSLIQSIKLCPGFKATCSRPAPAPLCIVGGFKLDIVLFGLCVVCNKKTTTKTTERKERRKKTFPFLEWLDYLLAFLQIVATNSRMIAFNLLSPS